MGLTKIDDRGLKTPIDLLDNEKIRLGTGNDLELYHDGSGSHILNSAGSGQLTISSDNALNLASRTGTEYFFRAYTNGGAELYHNNSKKLETTSSGVTVTGTLEATTYLVIADQMYHAGDADTTVRFPAPDTIALETAGSERFRVDSAGRVLIGTNTVGDANGDDLTVAASGHSGITIRSGTSSTSQLMFTDSTSGTGSYIGIVAYRHASDSMGLFTNATERLTIDSSGKVGIGLTNPVNNLDVSGSISATGNMLNTAYADGVYIGTEGGLPAISAGKASNSAYAPLVFSQAHQAAGAERMRIDANGILLVGATSAVGGGTAIEARHDSNAQQGRIMANGFMARNNYGTPTNITNGMYSPNDKVLAFATDSKERLRFTDKGELEIGNHLNSGNVLKQITRASGNTSETITAPQLGLDDNNYAVIWVVISGPNLQDWGHSLFSWRMARGSNSAIITQIDSMASGSNISLFTQAVSSNSLVIQKDSDCELNVTVIGGGGRQSVIGW